MKRFKPALACGQSFVSAIPLGDFFASGMMLFRKGVPLVEADLSHRINLSAELPAGIAVAHV